MCQWLVEMVDIWKRFGNHPVLNGVDFTVKPGEIHGLLGKNGAGKSVLMKILAGVVPKDSGSIVWRGRTVEIPSAGKARELGISMVYQELSLFPELTVAENIFVGEYRRLGMVRYGMIDFEQAVCRAESALEGLHFEIDPRVKVSRLGFGQRQMVEIARAIIQNVELLILDEPTAALSAQETGHVFAALRKLTQKGIAVIYISHRLGEMKAIADRITVLRDGVNVGSKAVHSTAGEELLTLMVGEAALDRHPRLGLPTRRELLRLERLAMAKVLRDISFSLHEGEILGIAGLAGSGRTALIHSILGMGSSITGKVFLRGREIGLRSVRQAIKLGFAYLAEDRTRSGLFHQLSVKDNISVTNLRRVTKRGFIDGAQESRIAQGLMKRLGVVLPNVHQKAAALSGGNQQKILLARWLYSGGYIYLLDEPTCGLDIASKVDLYNIINSLVCGGAGVLMISSDLSELIGMCHRILVICQGTVVGELTGGNICEAEIVRLASGKA